MSRITYIIQEFFNKLSKEYNINIPKALIEKVFIYKKIYKGELICHAEDIQKFMYYVHSGLFRYYYINEKGNDITKHFVKQGDYAVSYLSFIYQIPSAYYIEAIEDSNVLEIDYTKYITCIENEPIFGIIARKYIEYIYQIKEKREAAFLLYDAKQRYLNFIENNTDICNKIKQKHIASYLGITSETLSRIKRKL